MRRLLANAGALLAWWIALFWLWLLLVGEWDRYEWIAGAGAGALAATAAEVVRRSASLSVRVPLRRVAQAWRIPFMVFADFGLLAYALARTVAGRRAVHGVFRADRFPAGGDDPRSLGTRAWLTITATYSPNSYVVDISRKHDTVLVHQLVRRPGSEPPP